MTKTDKERMLTGYYFRAFDYWTAYNSRDIDGIKLLDTLEEEFRYYLYCVYDPNGDFIGADIESDDLNAFLDAARAADDEAEKDAKAGSRKEYADAAAFVGTLGVKDDTGC